MENKDFTKSILIQPMAKYIAHYLQSSCLFLVNSTFYKIVPPPRGEWQGNPNLDIPSIETAVMRLWPAVAASASGSRRQPRHSRDRVSDKTPFLIFSTLFSFFVVFSTSSSNFSPCEHEHYEQLPRTWATPPARPPAIDALHGRQAAHRLCFGLVW